MSRSRATDRSDPGSEPSVASPDAILDALANRRRRAVLSVLESSDRPVSVATLAGRVAARTASESSGDASDERSAGATDESSANDPSADGHPADERRHRVEVALHHADLPKLVAVGLVRHDAARDAVSATRRPAFGRTEFHDLLRFARSDATDSDTTRPVDTDPGRVDAVLSALAHARRRTVLSLLADAGTEGLELADLAARVAADSSEETPRVAETGLRHVHLPVLADAGLVEYDPDSGVAKYDSEMATGPTDGRRPDHRWFDDPLAPPGE